MQPIRLAVNEPFAAPPGGANWVVFTDSHNYAPIEDTPRMLTRALRYAKKYGVYLVPCKFLQNSRICMCLISPDGEPILGQEAMFLNLNYRGEELQRGDSINVADTPFGRVGLCVDVDVNYPEYIKALAARGAQVVFSSRQLEMFDAVESRIRTPVMSAALSSGVYIVSVTNSGCCIAGPDGRLILPVRDALSITVHILADELILDQQRIATGQMLVDNYYARKGRDADV